MFKDQSVELPECQYDKPFSLILNKGADLMIFWVATENDFNMWTQAFKQIMVKRNHNEHKAFKELKSIRKTSKNTFVTKMYEFLKPKRSNREVS